MSGKVKDGTPCSPHRNDVCIDGICEVRGHVCPRLCSQVWSPVCCEDGWESPCSIHWEDGQSVQLPCTPLRSFFKWPLNFLLQPLPSLGGRCAGYSQLCIAIKTQMEIMLMSQYLFTKHIPHIVEPQKCNGDRAVLSLQFSLSGLTAPCT